MTFEEIEGRHIAEWGGVEVWPPDSRMAGFAARLDGRLVALAAVYLDDAGRWRAAFAQRPGANGRVHIEVRKALAEVFEAGVEEIIADPDPEVARSEDYLRWLGFVPREDQTGDWVLCRSSLKA